MNIEEKIFKKFAPVKQKLIDYGFKQIDSKLVFEKLFKDSTFKAIIKVKNDGKVEGSVFDIENNDEFLPLRVENQKGSFVGKIRKEYEKILEGIRQNCFIKEYFVLPQSNRITNLIMEKYQNEPEFLWEKYDDTGIFRNPVSNKWYAIIMDVDRSKIQKDKTGFTEVLGVKLHPQHVNEIIKKENFYSAYHLNKKHWIVIILDETVKDEKIMELIEESHLLTDKKSK